VTRFVICGTAADLRVFDEAVLKPLSSLGADGVPFSDFEFSQPGSPTTTPRQADHNPFGNLTTIPSAA
jgi:hypothetical protein